MSNFLGSENQQMFTSEELKKALSVLLSLIDKCKKAQQKLVQGTSHYSLLHNRIQALSLSVSLIENALKNL